MGADQPERLGCQFALLPGYACRPGAAQAGDDQFRGTGGEGTVERLQLRAVAAQVGAHPGVMTEDRGMTGCRTDPAQSGLDQGSLAAAVGAEDGKGTSREEVVGYVCASVE